MFNFEKEMVYGKKHVNILNYDNAQYDFRPYLKECFNVNDLSMIHENNPSYSKFETFGPDVATWYHKTFYDFLNTERGENMQKLYDKMIKNVILPYLKLDKALVQKFPSFRIQLPNNVAVAKKHTDNSLGHPIGEINFTYTFTDMYDTNSIWIEKMPRSEQYIPIEMKANNNCSFNANLCMHYNKLNQTNKSRISMDYRILPMNYVPNIESFSHSTNKKFIDGEYYNLVNL